MSGLTGYYSASINEFKERSTLIKQMAAEIRCNKADIIETWSESKETIAWVHHNVVNPESQTIFNESGTMCIFMDGEVFDYKTEKEELIKKGYKCKYKNKDAEFCLHLYEEFGKDAFLKLNGSFLIIVYNKDFRELLWSTINDPESLSPNIFNIEVIRNTYNGCIKRQGNFYKILFLLLNFGRRNKKYGAK